MRKIEKQKDSVGKIMGNILDAILPDDDTVAYYRGQRGLDYLLVPKAMRVYPDSNNNPIPDYETSVTNDLVVNYPEEFGEVSPLIRLSRIEHRDLASRLVNISASVLNSLFFSCSALTEKDSDGGDPYLFRFDFKSTGNKMRRYDSDTGKLLTAIPQLTTKQQSQLRYDAVMDYACQIYSHYIVFTGYIEEENDLYSIYRVIFRSIQTALAKCLSEDALKNEIYRKLRAMSVKESLIESLAESVSLRRKNGYTSFEVDGIEFDVCSCEDYYGHVYHVFYPDSSTINMRDMLNAFRCRQKIDSMLVNPETGSYDSGVMCELHWKVLADYPYFLELANPLSLLNGIFIQPTMSSERMIVQQGAFMLYGLSSFWNVGRTIDYLLKRKYSWAEVLEILISEDTSFLCENPSVSVHKPYYGKLDTKKLKRFLEYVYDASIIKLDVSADSLREALRKCGITKASAGRTPEMSIATLNEKLGINR